LAFYIAANIDISLDFQQLNVRVGQKTQFVEVEEIN